MSWTKVSKPNTASNWVDHNAQGKEQYNESDIFYDDSTVFYDSLNPNQWTSVSKPGVGTWTKIAKPT